MPYRDQSGATRRTNIAPKTTVQRECQAMTFFNTKPHLPRFPKWRSLLGKLMPASVSYRPERHYMRGPGPKYRERHPHPVTPRRSA
ncbi:MAG: hypothetical protein ACREIC_26005 [Limisphaerales bacterium]